MPADFIFTENMIRETYLQKENEKTRKGQNPFHRSLKRSGDFTLLAWDAWLLLVPFLKKELRKRCPNKSLRESKGNPLFKLTHIDKVFTLHVLQGWAAKRLGLPKKRSFEESNPIKIYTEIVCKFLGKNNI
jgi:hypothetical protein